MPHANGSRSMIQTVVTSVVVASILSAGGAYVSVSVMSADLDRAKTDVSEASKTITKNREGLVALEAAKAVADARDDQRWTDVRDDLKAIRSTQESILEALPPRWRAATEQRHR